MNKKTISIFFIFLFLSGCSSSKNIPMNKVYSDENIEIGVINETNTPLEKNLIKNSKK